MNKSKPDSTLTISFLGVDQRSMSAYEFFFKGIKDFNCDLSSNNSQPQICLVDIDAYNIEHEYHQYRDAHPQTYLLLLSLGSHPELEEQEFFLRKPVKKDALLASINEIHQVISGKIKLNDAVKQAAETINEFTAGDESTQEVTVNLQHNHFKIQSLDEPAAAEPIDKKIVAIKEKRKVATAQAGKLLTVANEKDFVGEQSDIDLNDIDLLPQIYYDPKKFLQSIVEKVCLKSRQTEGIIQLNVLNYTFYFDYQEQKVYSTVGPGIIRPLCLLPHENHVSYKIKDLGFRQQLHEIMQSNKNQKTKKTQEKQSWNMESFVWLITLWSSRGRLPRGTSLSSPVYLMQWPNLTRLEALPHAVRISALLYQQPHTLPDIARQLGIEQRYVFSFYSACKAIGLANISKRQIDTTFAPEQPAVNKNKSILVKLLGRLVGFRSKTKMTESA